MNNEQLAINNEQLAMSNEQLAINNEQLTGNNEQLTMNNEQLAMSNEQSAVTELVEVSTEADDIADIEEKPSAEYVGNLSVLDEPESREPESLPTVAMETLRPVGTASPLEPTSPAEQASPLETLPKPSTALPEQRTAQVVPPDFSPPVRESRPQPGPKRAEPRVIPFVPPAITQEPPPLVEEQPVTSAEAESRGSPPEKRIILPDYPITFSRTARVTVGQLVEIPFRGRDWVFLGEVGARRGIAYDSRKMDPEGESFIFKVEASGVYALKFYRQDFAHDLILNDHVQIIAGAAPETTGLGWFNPPTDRSRVVAGPRWPNFLNQPQIIDSQSEQQLVIEEKEIAPIAETKQTDANAARPPAATQPPVATQPPTTAQPPAARQPAEAALPPKAAQPPATPPARQPSNARTEPARPQGLSGGEAVAQSSPAQTPSPPPPPAAETKSPDAILKEARDEFNAGRIAAAITLLDQFCKSYPSGSDEAWWLYGQCYEANSPNRNILSALDYYRRLVREYPQSSRLSDARRRVAYLERYYINIQ